jgi:hypothetical protein
VSDLVPRIALQVAVTDAYFYDLICPRVDAQFAEPSSHAIGDTELDRCELAVEMLIVEPGVQFTQFIQQLAVLRSYSCPPLTPRFQSHVVLDRKRYDFCL